MAKHKEHPLVGRVKKAVKKSQRKLSDDKFEKELQRTINFLTELKVHINELQASAKPAEPAAPSTQANASPASPKGKGKHAKATAAAAISARAEKTEKTEKSAKVGKSAAPAPAATASAKVSKQATKVGGKTESQPKAAKSKAVKPNSAQA